jgi:hypothetical protein
MQDRPQDKRGLLRSPLMRLLAINLAIGVGAAILLVGGLLALNPGGLRHLIFADHAPGVAIGLLVMSFVITFGSTAMGTAIMALGKREQKDNGPRGGSRQHAAEAMIRTGRS